ncbi:MAG: ABC transporter permease [Bernardetiaceae bacterium]|nr:ABC transporter permease [Bernardetiaceae bacterium]
MQTPVPASTPPANVWWFIARRISQGKNAGFSSLITNIAIGSVAVGLAAGLLSFLIFKGFRQAIQDKIFSLSGHLAVQRITTDNSIEGQPLRTRTRLAAQYQRLPEVAHLQMVSKKAALLKTETEVMGAILKGVGPDFDTLRFARNLVSGRFLHFTDSAPANELIVSQKIARKLKLKLGDDLIVYFIQEPPRARRLTVRGIYQTGLEDFDDAVVLGDNRLIQRLNNWGDSLTGGYELFVHDFEQLPQASDRVADLMDFSMGLTTVRDQYLHFFDWFTMLSNNVVIFLTIILFVAGFNTLSILLILIMERTSLIGTLKALGASNRQIQQVFLYRGLRILLAGLAWGNLLGLGLAALQWRYGLVPLDPETYYMASVPIQWDWPNIIMLNLLMFSLVALIMVLPTLVITRISPIKAIRFA